MSGKLWPAALAGLKQNFLPGLVLQAVALVLVLSYYFCTPARELFERVAVLKRENGFVFSALSTGFFGGVVPFAYLALTKQIRRSALVPHLLFYIVFWAYKGVEVDAFYRLQARIFGDEASFGVIAKKVFVDQFVYGPAWAAMSMTVPYFWKDSDFSLRRLRPKLNREFFTLTLPSVQVAAWAVWIPAVSIVYCLPQALQIPLFNIVLCFWVLMLSFLTLHKDKSRPAQAAAPDTDAARVK